MLEYQISTPLYILSAVRTKPQPFVMYFPPLMTLCCCGNKTPITLYKKATFCPKIPGKSTKNPPRAARNPSRAVKIPPGALFLAPYLLPKHPRIVSYRLVVSKFFFNYFRWRIGSCTGNKVLQADHRYQCYKCIIGG